MRTAHRHPLVPEDIAFPAHIDILGRDTEVLLAKGKITLIEHLYLKFTKYLPKLDQITLKKNYFKIKRIEMALIGILKSTPLLLVEVRIAVIGEKKFILLFFDPLTQGV